VFTPDPAALKKCGRPLRYGAPAPTPEQFRSDDREPWQTMAFTHSGVTHQLRFKRRQNRMWRTAGVQQILQLLIVAPLAYRLRKGSKLLYRHPAYLICTDPALEPRQALETYFQRWDIEVNFRDEKTLLGVGQAQVRAEASVESAPALTVAAYALLLVSAQRAFPNSDGFPNSGGIPNSEGIPNSGGIPNFEGGLLPPPKWAARCKAPRTSTQQILHQLRAEVWGRGLGIETFSGFASQLHRDTKPKKCSFPLASAVCYANG
jgi:hypothetical protein